MSVVEEPSNEPVAGVCRLFAGRSALSPFVGSLLASEGDSACFWLNFLTSSDEPSTVGIEAVQPISAPNTAQVILMHRNICHCLNASHRFTLMTSEGSIAAFVFPYAQ